MINNIEQLYNRVIDKKGFVELVANDVNKSYTGINSNWFSSWKIPEKHQGRVHTLLINFLIQEMLRTEEIINDEP